MLSRTEKSSSIFCTMRCCSARGGKGTIYDFNFSSVIVSTVVPFQYSFICSSINEDENNIEKYIELSLW